MSTEQLNTEWITFCYKNLFYRGPQYFYFLNITHLWKPCICWLDFVNKILSFMWNTRNTDRNSINGQNIHPTHTETKNITLERVSQWWPKIGPKILHNVPSRGIPGLKFFLVHWMSEYYKKHLYELSWDKMENSFQK